MLAKKIVTYVFRRAGITINGPNVYDPQILNEGFYGRLLLQGSLGLGNMYMEDWYRVARLDLMIYMLLRSGLTDLVPRFDDWWLKIRSMLVDRQDKVRGKRVAHEHYDEDPDFFIGVLGQTNSYTCARFVGTESLDHAQVKKMDILCRKVELHRGESVLDIGCGWGGFAAHAAVHYGVRVTGLSISESQLAHARAHYGNLPIDFRNMDYRDFSGRVDKAVSICMIEHVGPKHYREYFEMVRRAMPKGGLFALQCISAENGTRSTSDPWVDEHIFPGGNLVTLDRLDRAARDLFCCLDIEEFGHDYVKTLRAWHANLVARKDAVVAKYGMRHFRKYEYYFLAFAGGFLSKRITVRQLVYATERRAYTPVRL